jgi:outer membrane protein assembly factor BamE (lipoprotein component of BamABCDE complex)
MHFRFIALIVALVALGTGCQTASQHSSQLGQDDGEELTVGLAQKRISVGMSQADVAGALGSPNIVTKDAHGKEAWVYDKAAREVSYSRDQGGIWFIIGGYAKEAGAARSSQKTLTIVIKFSQDGKVEDVTYHSSKF